MIIAPKPPDDSKADIPPPRRGNALFESGHLEKGLNRRIAKSGVITMGTQLAKYALRMASVAILARFLTPADFGLIGLVTVVTGFVELFKDAGLSMATIQKKTVTHEQVSTLFWINFVLSIGLVVVEAALAPVIAWYYKDPRLLDVTLILASLTVCGGLSVQHQALLRRNMEFGRIAVCDLLSTLSGLVLGAFMATHGYGYWSLVGMSAGTAISSLVLSFALSGWIPSLPSRGTGVKPMLKFGSHLAGANFFNYLTRNSDNFIVGSIHGPAALGIYSRGYALFLMPMQQFLTPISSVVIPALARVVHDARRFREIFLEKSYMVIFCVVLATGGSFAGAPEIVRILLGPGWDEAVIIVRCLALGGAIYGTNIAGSWISSTHGRADRQLKVAMVVGPSYCLSFWIGSFYGLSGVAIAFSVTCTILRYPVFCYLCRDTPITPMDMVRPLLQTGAVATVAAAFAMLGAHWLPLSTPVAILAAKATIYLAVVAVFCATGLLRLPKISRGNDYV